MKQPEDFRDNVKASLTKQADAGPDNSLRPRRQRAFELDALRGLAVLMMVLHHLIYDLRYLLGLDVFAWQETKWFDLLLRPFFLAIFLIGSGITSTFTRSNLRRGLRLGAVAIAYSIVMAIVSLVMQTDFYIFFNVLHLLAVGSLVYAGISRRDKGAHTDTLLVFLLVLIFYAALIMPAEPASTWLLLPLGILPANAPAMADYLPILPWLGFFLAGALIGRLQYRERKTAFPNAPQWLLSVSQPFIFLGRNSLWIYILHQPLLMLILFGLRFAGLI